MLEAPARTGTNTAAFDALDRALRADGPGAALGHLIQHLTESHAYRALLDALLLKARHDLGLPLIHVGSLMDIPEPVRSQYEERYIEAIRTVGQKFLEAGDIPAAWPYFRAISEPEPVSRAIDAFDPAEGDDRLGSIIEVAFSQGANPRKGFELILNHYGTCSAISAFEQLPQDEATRVACADRLVRQLHAHLAANLRAEIAYKGEEPHEGASISEMIRSRDWLFDDDAYHLDVSHLAATVRIAPLLSDPSTMALAIELTDYGRRLSDRHKYEGEPPFERTYEDHGAYLRAVLGQNVEEGLAQFRAKLQTDDSEGNDNTLPAQVLVTLLLKMNRLDEAIEIAAEYLAGLPESALICPSVAQLCQRAGASERLVGISREQGDLVNYTAAILQANPQPGSKH